MILLNAYFAMLCLGIAHHTDHRVPAFGYWTVLCVFVVVELARGTFWGTKHD